MRRGLRAVAAGLLAVVPVLAVVAGTATGTAFADGAGPVATPPTSPQTQTVSGVAANGVQLSVTAPRQLPVDLPGRQLPEREVDVTVKDAGGQGYSGDVNMTLTAEGSGASAGSLRLDHYDLASGAWQTESIPSGQSSFSVADTVTVPANGTQVLKLRLSPGTTVVDDVKLSVSANGASAVATMPVTGPAFQATGLTAAARAGAPTVFTARLNNPTDVDVNHVSVKLALCSAGSAGCVAHATDVKVEVAVTGGTPWHAVSVSDGSASSPLAATVVPDVELPPGGALSFSVRVTVGAGAFGAPGQPGQSGQPTGQPTGQPSSQAPAQPLSVPLAIGPIGLTLVGQPTAAGTLTVQPPPQQAAPSTPFSTPSSSLSSSTPSAGPTVSIVDVYTPTAAPTDTPTPAATTEVAASTPSAPSSSSPTILVAAGLLAVCLALVLWWVLLKRRERMAHAAGLELSQGYEHESGHEQGPGPE